MMKKTYILIAFVALLMACNSGIPEEYQKSDALPSIYPDYTNVTVPINIAPLTFEMGKNAQKMAVRFTAGDLEVICNGEKIQPSAKDWKNLLASAEERLLKSRCLLSVTGIGPATSLLISMYRKILSTLISAIASFRRRMSIMRN